MFSGYAHKENRRLQSQKPKSTHKKGKSQVQHARRRSGIAAQQESKKYI